MLCYLEGSGELFNGSLGGVEGLRLFASTSPILQGFLPHLCFRKMDGEIRQMRSTCRCVKTLDGLSNGAVQCFPFTYEQFCVHGLPRQRVTECKLLCRLLDDQLGRDQLPDQAEQFVLIVVCHL